MISIVDCRCATHSVTSDGVELPPPSPRPALRLGREGPHNREQRRLANGGSVYPAAIMGTDTAVKVQPSRNRAF